MTDEGSGDGRALGGLIGTGVAGLALYVAVARLGNLLVRPVEFTVLFVGLLALYAVACWLVLRAGGARRSGRGMFRVIATFALAYRLVLVPTVPSLSDDFFRYVWDGFIQGRGLSPYRYPPQASALVPLRDGYYWPRVNRKEQTSAYPPLAELTFRALFLVRAFDSTIFKLGFVALDLTTVGLLAVLLRLRGRPPAAAIIYAWHPLPIIEFAGSAHIDVLAVVLLVAALVLEVRGRHVAAGVLLGLATLTKLYPGLLLPAFTRRDRRGAALACVATVAVGFAPAFLTGDTNFRQLPTYLREEGYANGERFFPLALLRSLLHMRVPAALAALYVGVAAVVLVALAWWLVFGPTPAGPLDVPRRTLVLTGALLLLVTPAYPWYFTWLIPLVAVVPVVALWYLTTAVAIIYLAWNWPGASHPSFTLFSAAIYLPAWALLAAAARRHRWSPRTWRSRRRGTPPHPAESAAE